MQESTQGTRKAAKEESLIETIGSAFHMDRYRFALLLVVLFGIFLSYVFFYGPSPITGADNYLYIQFAHEISRGNIRAVAQNGVLAQQYLLIAGISAFLLLLGATTPFTASIFGVLCFALTLVALYGIGAKLYNKKAGVLSAFVYSFNPVAVVNSSYVGDNGPMAFLATLSVMFFAFAIKEQDEKARSRYYALSGFVLMMDMLVSSQSIVLLAFALPILLILLIKNRNRESFMNICFYALGLLAGFAVLLLIEIAVGNAPFYIFTLNYGIYTDTSVPLSMRINDYAEWLFPYRAIRTVSSFFELLRAQQIPAAAQTLAQAIASMFDVHKMSYPSGQANGLFGYFMVLGAIYLVYHGNLRLLIPAFWFVSTFLYMGVGTVSISHYVPIDISYVRLMLIYLPSLGLIIGFALTDLSERGRRGVRNCIVALALFLIVLPLFTNALLMIHYIDMSQYRAVWPLVQLGNFVKGLPEAQGADALRIYLRPIFPLDLYTSYKYRTLTMPLDFPDCNWLPANGYLVLLKPNASIALACNLTEVYRPPPLPQYLLQFNLLDNNTFGSYENTTVYYRASPP